jgi:hypothetical protein
MLISGILFMNMKMDTGKAIVRDTDNMDRITGADTERLHRQNTDRYTDRDRDTDSDKDSDTDRAKDMDTHIGT